MRSSLLAAALLLVAPGVAGAAVTTGDYGGGAITRDDPVPPRAKARDGFTGSSWISAHVGGDGQVRIGGSVAAGCGLARFETDVRLAADGSFRFTAEDRDQGIRSTVTVAGRFDGVAASGTLRAKRRDRDDEGRRRTCGSGGEVGWQLRLRPVVAAPGAPIAGATYFGLTEQGRALPKPFVLRVGARPDRVVSAVYEYLLACRAGGLELNTVTPGARIRADGMFTIRDRWTWRSPGETMRVRMRLDGRFGAGGVAGVLRITSVTRLRRSGRAIDRCDTGRVTFSAAP